MRRPPRCLRRPRRPIPASRDDAGSSRPRGGAGPGRWRARGRGLLPALGRDLGGPVHRAGEGDRRLGGQGGDHRRRGHGGGGDPGPGRIAPGDGSAATRRRDRRSGGGRRRGLHGAHDPGPAHGRGRDRAPPRRGRAGAGQRPAPAHDRDRPVPGDRRRHPGDRRGPGRARRPGRAGRAVRGGPPRMVEHRYGTPRASRRPLPRCRTSPRRHPARSPNDGGEPPG